MTKPNISNGFLTVSETNNSNSNRRRSHSITPSQRSSRSCITIVENNPELTTCNDPKADDTYVIRTIKEPKYSRWEHFKAAFGFRSMRQPIIEEEFVKPPRPKLHRRTTEDSPWIQPVFVLSSRNDTDKHKIPQVASATIDTGNQIGNLVSRAFVEEALEFSRDNFCALTADEKRGRGITGHELVPEGAIYLTWYSKKGPKVFRNMRFLVVSIDNYDLIIGAKSAYNDKLLDIPCFMGVTFITGTEDDVRKKHTKNVRNLNREVVSIKNTIKDKNLEKDALKEQIVAAKKAKNNELLKNLMIDRNNIKQELQEKEPLLKPAEQKLEVAKKELQIFEADHDKRLSAAAKAEKVAELQAELEALPGYVKPQNIAVSSTTQSSAVDDAQAKKRPWTRSATDRN